MLAVNEREREYNEGIPVSGGTGSAVFQQVSLLSLLICNNIYLVFEWHGQTPFVRACL